MSGFWRELFSPRDAHGAEQTLLLCTYILGLTPFRLRGPAGQRQFQLSRIGYLNALLQLSFFSYCFLRALIQQQSIVGYFFKSEISEVGDSLQKFIGMTGMSILFLCSTIRVRLLIHLCNLISHIDGHLLDVGVSFNYPAIMRLRHSQLLLMSAVQLAYLASSTWMLLRNDVRPSYPVAVAFYVPLIFLLSTVILFGAFLHRLWQHFEALNKRLINHRDSNPRTRSARSPFRYSYAMWLFNRLVYMTQPHDVYTCYRVTLWLALWLGIVPYHVTSASTRLCSSYFGYFNIILRMLIYVVNFVYSILDRRSLMSNFFLTEISNVIDGLQKVNGMFGIIAILLISLIQRRKLLQVLAIYDALERESFPRVGITHHQGAAARRMNRFVLLMAGSTVAYITGSFLMISTRDADTFSMSAIISYFSPHFIVCAVCFMTGNLMIKLHIYLSALHKVLKNLSHQWDSRSLKAVAQKQRSLQCLDSFSMYTIVTKDPAEIIQESMEIHHLICEAAATANKYFTYQLLTIISIAFLIIVFDAYYVLETLLGKSKRESKFKTVEFVTFFSCQMILYLIAIISIVEGSNRAIKKSEKTGGIVHSLMNKTKCPEVKEKLQQFSMQLMHLKINFTAAGLFNIDRTLYFTISGALTTYLIILLQFTSNSPSNGNGNANGNYYPCCETFNNITNHTN